MDDRWDRRELVSRGETLSYYAMTGIAMSGAFSTFLLACGLPATQPVVVVGTWSFLILGAIVFTRWLRFQFDNAGAWTDDRLPFSSSDAVWSFFIPFVNLYRPWQVMDALWKASDPTPLPAAIVAPSARTDVGYRTGPAASNAHNFSTTSPVLTWALVYIWAPLAVSLLGIFAMFAVSPSVGTQLSTHGAYVSRAIAAVVACVMVRRIQQRIAERVRRIEALQP